MAPGLMPGEVVASDSFPALNRRRVPSRFERWTLVEPGGAMAVKRVWALPGEEITILDGDLAVDGAVLVKPPAVLAELALPVTHELGQHTATRVRMTIAESIFDDVPFAPEERRLLMTVRDVGITAVVNAAPGWNPAPVEVRVGDRVARVRLPTAGRFAVVAGRLDGWFVAGAWPCREPCDGSEAAAVPRGGPGAWNLARPWTGSAPVTTCSVAVGGETAGIDGGVEIERAAVWRDVHALAPASGASQWLLGGDEYYVLGDFPGGSRDSRHWGPLHASRLRHRVTLQRSPNPTCW